MDYTRVLKLPQYFRNLQRVREIVSVLVRHGMGDLVRRLDLQRFLPGHSKVYTGVGLTLEQPPEFAIRLRRVCEDLGPTFIKFGQLVASRPDIFPEPIVQEFRKLQDSVAEVSFSEIRTQIESEFSKSPSELFATFEQVPLAAASIAQVHRATLPDGTQVVVKVRRPGLIRVIETDLEILKGIAVLVEDTFPEATPFSPRVLVEEFARTLKRECDLKREAQALQQFAASFRQQPRLKIPRIVQNLCSSAVLTEEYVSGVRIDDQGKLATLKADRNALATTLTQVILKSIFELRFFHADPHPGNLLVTDDGCLAMIDFGCMGRLAPSRIEQILRFLAAVASRDAERMLHVLYEQEMLSTVDDEALLICQLSEVVESYVGQDLGQLDLMHLINDTFEIVRRFDIKLPADLFLVGKALTMLESLVTGLDPSVKPMDEVQRYLQTHAHSALLDPARTLANLSDTLISYRRLLTTLPRELNAAIRKLSHDKLVLRCSNADLALVRLHQNKIANRTLSALIALVLLGLGVWIQHFERNQSEVIFAYLLISFGSLGLLRVWFAIRTSGGV